jgi:Asp-tRNA(Asn)/Glu-tRNA(Gln) amidotransferase A subunit family amidase
VGFKPTFGRISTQGLIAASPTFDHVGFLTRTVEDMQLVFSPASLGPPASVRVGVARSYFFEDLDPAVATVVTATIAKIRSDGMTVADVAFPATSKTMSQIFDPVFSFELWNRFAAVFSTPRPSIAEYEAGLAALKEYQAGVDKLFDSVDVIVTPTVPMVAPPIAGPIDGMKILRNTWPFNAAGTPAISIPLKTTGLPVGLQLIARRGDDDKLLQIARYILS